MIMQMNLELTGIYEENPCFAPNFFTLYFNWEDIIDVLYQPTGKIMKRLVSNISLYDDLVVYKGHFYKICSTLSF
jgi:hypothetical protein